MVGVWVPPVSHSQYFPRDLQIVYKWTSHLQCTSKAICKFVSIKIYYYYNDIYPIKVVASWGYCKYILNFSQYSFWQVILFVYLHITVIPEEHYPRKFVFISIKKNALDIVRSSHDRCTRIPGIPGSDDGLTGLLGT